MSLSARYAHKEALISEFNKRHHNADDCLTFLELMTFYECFADGFPKLIAKDKFLHATALLNDYRQRVRAIQRNLKIAYTGPFYSSTLEELCNLLFLDTAKALIKMSSLDFEYRIGKQSCVICVHCDPIGTAFYEQKNMDWALAFKAPEFNNHWIAMLAVEAKRYPDSNMHHTVVHTMEYLGRFRPITEYFLLGENEARGEELIVNSVSFDREFLLTGLSRPKDDKSVQPFLAKELKHFYEDLKRAMGLAFLRMHQTAARKSSKKKPTPGDGKWELIIP